MDSVPFVSGNQRREAARTTNKVEATTAKVEAALTSREEAAKLRRRLLKMIVENEKIVARHLQPTKLDISPVKFQRDTCRRRWACYRLAIAGTIVCAPLATTPVAYADFSAATFQRVWAAEFPADSDQAEPAEVVVPPQTGFQPHPTATTAAFDFRSQQPHPAVARIVVPEQGATSFGSGTLVDVRENFGIVITNWHVVRDAQGPIEVIFPGGFTSKARALKVDADWDLAALVIWRPPVAPVKIATLAPAIGRSADDLRLRTGNLSLRDR